MSVWMFRTPLPLPPDSLRWQTIRCNLEMIHPSLWRTREVFQWTLNSSYIIWKLHLQRHSVQWPGVSSAKSHVNSNPSYCTEWAWTNQLHNVHQCVCVWGGGWGWVCVWGCFSFNYCYAHSAQVQTANSSDTKLPFVVLVDNGWEIHRSFVAMVKTRIYSCCGVFMGW